MKLVIKTSQKSLWMDRCQSEEEAISSHALMLFPEWFSAVKKIPVQDLKAVSEDEMKTQYKLFVNRLETITSEYSIDELQNLDLKILIKKILCY